MLDQQIDKRTYKQILESFIIELNQKGAGLVFDKLSDEEKTSLMAILIEQCKKSMKPFVIHVLGYKWRWFHEIWYNNFLKYDINCSIASRGLGKSFFWSRMLPDYCAFIISDYKTILSSYNEKATNDFLKDHRSDFEENEVLFNNIAQGKSDDWNKSNLDFTNKSITKAISITSQIRRLHVNYFSADDLLNDEQKLTPEQIKTKIFATILPTLEIRRGKFSIVGTRFAEDDVYMMFREMANNSNSYKYCEFRVELDETEEKVYIVHEEEDGVKGKYLDTGITDIYDFHRLQRLKIADPNFFAREYGCSVVSDDDVPFPVNRLLDCRDKELTYEDVASPRTIYKGSLDSSNSTKKDADETVLGFGYKDSDSNFVIANIFSDNKLESPERMAAIKKRMNDFGRPEILAEQNSMGLTNIQNLNKEAFRLTPLHMDRIKKIDLTDYASRMVKSGKVRMPYKRPKDQAITDKLIHQLSGVRPKKSRGGLPSYDGTTKHDDYYIMFVLLLKILSSGSGPTKVFSYKKEDLQY